MTSAHVAGLGTALPGPPLRQHDLWTAQLNDNASLPATVGEVAAWQALARDGGSLRTGETALLALVVLAKPQPPHPLSLGIAVRALKASGMDPGRAAKATNKNGAASTCRFPLATGIAAGTASIDG